jgi:hypothetical protein
MLGLRRLLVVDRAPDQIEGLAAQQAREDAGSDADRQAASRRGQGVRL